MTKTQIAATAIDENPNDNKSIPYGLVRTVRHYLEFVGLMDYIRGLKAKGVRLDLTVVALCTFTMHSSNSMNACSEWLKDPAVKRRLGFSSKDEISQRTLNRAIGILGKNREGIIARLWKGIQERFEIEDYDINLDGSAAVLYGPKSEYGAIGYGRDKNRGKLQVEFMVAQLASLGIPIYIKPYKGNVSDEAQYRDCVPELAGLMSGEGIHSLDGMKDDSDPKEAIDATFGAIAAVAMLGAAIVADNGAASDRNTRRMESCGFSYLTRVSINASDLKNIENHCSEFEYVGEGMMCYTHHFASSGRTTYLFLSRDLLEKGRHKNRNSLRKDLQLYEEARNGNLRKSDYVKVSKRPWINVEVKVTLQGRLTSYSETEIERLVRERMGIKCGFFKLESDRQLTAKDALIKYRRRVGVEHLISSLKRITGIKPIRVWNEESVNGSMVLALLSEAAVAMAQHCIPPSEIPSEEVLEETDDDTIMPPRNRKPSTESLVRSLSHLTLTWFKNGKGPFKEVLSNWGRISEAVFDSIRLHESPEWGSHEVSAC